MNWWNLKPAVKSISGLACFCQNWGEGIQRGTLQVLVALSTFFIFSPSSETFSNDNITIGLKKERTFQFLTVKCWGLVWETIVWSFFSFSQLVLIYKMKKRPSIIGCSETQETNGPSPGAHFSWLAEQPMKYEVVTSESSLMLQPFSHFFIPPNWKRKWEPHEI